MNTKCHICYRCVGGLGPAPEYSLVGDPDSVSPHGPRVVDSCDVLDPLRLAHLYPQLFLKIPRLWLCLPDV